MKLGFLKTFIALALTFVMASVSFGIPVKRQFQDMKLVTQQLVEKQTFTNPAVAGTTDVLSANAGNIATTAVTVSTFVAQPDITRNLVLTPGSTTADIALCTVVINGTDFHGQTISENYLVTENQSTATTGSKAFKTVSSVVFPANCEVTPFGATWSIGYGEKLGLKRCLANAGDILFSLIDGAKEGTAPTMVKDAANIEGNTADFNGTMNGASDFVLYFFQNFAQSCFP